MPKTIGIVLFNDFEDLDAMGPGEVLGMFSKYSNAEWQVVFVSQDGQPAKSFLGSRVMADHSFDDCPKLDVIVVPGGFGTRPESQNPKMVAFLEKQGQRAEFVTSVCTGAFLLHSAGFLKGKRATTHWGAIAELKALPDVTVVDDERWVQDGNVLTAAGVSAGIDMALYLVSLLKDAATAQRVQQMMEYYPKPPVFETVKA